MYLRSEIMMTRRSEGFEGEWSCSHDDVEYLKVSVGELPIHQKAGMANQLRTRIHDRVCPSMTFSSASKRDPDLIVSDYRR